MLNFTQKISGITACYELDEQQHILIHSVCDGRKVITKQKINLIYIKCKATAKKVKTNKAHHNCKPYLVRDFLA